MGKFPLGEGGGSLYPKLLTTSSPLGCCWLSFLFFFFGGGVVFKTITVFYYKSKIKFILEILEYTVKYKEDKNQL